MDFNNAEEEIKNAIYEMEKSLVLEMEDNHNGLTYLIDGNKEQEKLLSLINTKHQKLSIFYKKQNFKEKIDSIINSKITKNTEIKNGKRKSSKGNHKIKNRNINEEKYRVLSHGLFIVDSNDENESDEGGNS